MPGIQTNRKADFPIRVGKRGTIVLPARLRRRFGIEEGTTVVAREAEDAIVLHPAVTLPVEIYTPERIAEFLLNNALNEKHYRRMVREVRKMGLDPAKIPHDKPPARP